MFNSRNPVYRNPVGAVAHGTNVHFKIALPRDLHCSAAVLRLTGDESGGAIDRGMFWCGMNGTDFEWWECDFTPGAPGLYFYDFQLSTWRGTLRLSRGFGGEGILGGGGVWQLTVYQKGFETPGWLAGGILYQIFPDRFYRSGEPKKNVPEDRRLHRAWDETPDWEPDAQGKITNRDYFGGDLKGVMQKLPYLKSLGVTCIYFNPVFEAHANHRYNTADYSRIDPLLGDEEDFKRLCAKAARVGIRVMLDGVFSHTGSDSVYFNREGRYGSGGAYNSQSSPYYNWYTFSRWPDAYDCWWNFITLPNVRENEPSYREYITGENGIVRKWLKNGASGWRLDVADELPDGFLDTLTAAARAEKPDALVLGEVWEDASNKTAYGKRRRYLLGGQLDSVMNYPFREAILGFLTGQNPADMMEIILSIQENYPPQVLRLLMNHIGTHDTERALTMLAGEPMKGQGRRWQSGQRLTREQRQLGLRLLRLAALMQYTLPGVPCVYYGDEAGIEGYCDPFNRGSYPWGREDMELLEWYRRLGRLRAQALPVLREGVMEPVFAGNGCMAYVRRGETQKLLIAVNSRPEPCLVDVPDEWRSAVPMLGKLPEQAGLRLDPYGCAALKVTASAF